MLKNYLKVAWRNIINNKALSFLNIMGLATGMAFALLIGIWIRYEISFDQFHANGKRISLIMKHTLYNDQKNTQESTPLPLYYELKDNYPEVKRLTRMNWGDMHSIVYGENKFNKNGRYVDPDFLEIFSFRMLKGNSASALNDPNSIILSESFARLLFKEEDPLGKFVKLDNQFDLQVTGVVEDAPGNSTIKFDYLAPYEFGVGISEFVRNSKTNWGNNFLMNVVELKEGVSTETFSKKIAALNTQKDSRIRNQTLFLHPLNKWHLQNDYKNWVNTGGRIQYVSLFGMIGVFILLIACINFMNLSTARSEKRAREVGIRKAVGSKRSQLILQFMSESMLVTLLSFVVSVILIVLMLPFLKNFGFENVRFTLDNLDVFGAALLICLFTGLLAGSYPALYLSALRPIKVLKGLFRQGFSAVVFRRALVISQFGISIGLIICTVIVFQQIRYAKERSLGYDPNNMISVGMTEDLAKNYQALKQEILSTGYFEVVAKASQPMTRIYNRWSDFSWDGKDPDADIAFDAIMTEWDLEKAAGLKFKLGRPFSVKYKTDSNAVILNEEAVKIMGYTNPIGRKMKTGDREITIVGVVENLVIDNPFKSSYPLAILFNANGANNIFVRVKDGKDLEGALAVARPVFEKFNPSYPFEYSFVDDEFNSKFSLETQVGKIAGVFAGLAVFISCLGLFGLSTFMAERRIKEIGIRKVLGASVANLWAILSKEFVFLVLAGCLIASPIAFWLMKDWLQKYDYRIEISFWVFIMAGILTIIITLITVSSHAIKTALSNPVKSLRTE